MRYLVLFGSPLETVQSSADCHIVCFPDHGQSVHIFSRVRSVETTRLVLVTGTITAWHIHVLSIAQARHKA